MDEEKEYYVLTQKAFDFLAPFFNVMCLPLVKVRDQVVSFSGAGENSIVLDIATGTGQQAFAFARKGCKVIGVDLTESMLVVARKNNKKDLVQLETGDATQLRFEDNRFDVSCISFALHDMPLTVRAKVLEEMVRVTKPNGSMVIVDYALPQNKVGRFLFYCLINLYEGKYYRDFVASALDDLYQSVGIKIAEQCSILLGAAKILKGIKSPSGSNS